MKIRICLVAFLVIFLQVNHVKSEEEKSENVDEEDVIALWMPFVNTTAEDEYYCMGIDVAWEKRYITKYVPHASQKSVHHILIYGCSSTITSKSGASGAWKCLNDHPVQAACQGHSKFLYAWAKDAPSLQLPHDVGFEIGSQTDVKGIFIQVHYSIIVEKDNSGISLILSSEPRKYAAGILLLAAGGQYIPPHEPVVNVNVMCQYNDDIVIHPFGFRTHAHGLGTVISGWYMKPEDKEKKLWTLLGKQSPQNPQAFYKMESAHNITKGTIFGARCVYNSTERDAITLMGPTHSDEMCNFYMMYYADRSTIREGCTDVDSDLQNWRLPDEASQLLPADQMIDHHHHDHEAVSESSATTTTSLPTIVVPGKTVTSLPAQLTSSLPRRRPDLEIVQDLTNGRGREGEMAVDNSIAIDKKSDGPVPLQPEELQGENGLMKTLVGERTNYGYEEVEHWGDSLKKLNLGQISGIALDHSDKKVYIFHRRDHPWDSESFGLFDNRYQKINAGPIAQSTILVVDKITAAVQQQLAEKMFYMPHGITVGQDGDIWVTDVALHQVMRLRDGKPTMILGVQFEPGHDGKHFCKPTSVAIQANGNFYVADGYCNSRVIQFTPDGRYMKHFGQAQSNLFGSIAPAPADFYIPHDIKLSDDESVLFVADRENGRVQAYATETMKFLRLYKVVEFGFKVYAIDVAGDLMVAVNGPASTPGESTPVQGILVNVSSGSTVNILNSKTTPFSNPHGISISRDQTCIFVVEISGNIFQFHQIGARSPSAPHGSSLHSVAEDHSLHGSHASNSSSLLKQLTSNPLSPTDGGYSFFLLAIFIVPTLLLCCGLGFCCLKKSRSSSKSKWKDVLYQYKSNTKDVFKSTGGGFKNSLEGFRPLRQEDMNDDSDSEEEVFSAQKSRKTNMA